MKTPFSKDENLSESVGQTVRPYRILSIDGGGVRGIISAIWLAKLEAQLNGPLYKHFDLIAGSSTGSFIACAIASGASAESMVELYRQHSRTVFPPVGNRAWDTAKRIFTLRPSGPRYSDAGLQSVLQNLFGETLFSELKVPTMVTTYNLLNRRILMLKSWREAHQDLPVWAVCKASASAPTYFPAHVMRIGVADLPLADGALVAGNPATAALAEALRYNREQQTGIGIENLIMASFGSGQSTRHISITDSQRWGPWEWSRPIADILLDGSSQAGSYVCKQLLQPDAYFRLQTRLNGALDDIDAATTENINALASVAQNHLINRGGQGQIEALAKRLKAELNQAV